MRTGSALEIARSFGCNAERGMLKKIQSVVKSGLSFGVSVSGILLRKTSNDQSSVRGFGKIAVLGILKKIQNAVKSGLSFGLSVSSVFRMRISSVL
ncbi:hypothetical protein [Piscirickettsia salmonis]|uniref:hypothetical protein n=1 Tax=Piscirickettsia salmonis TaxID=1238 RepID=UPI0012BA8BF1|nr:hypothetical protein [Piscirickettsia salmonis]